MKTTKAHLEKFRRYVFRWVELLQISGWDIAVVHADLSNSYAQIFVDGVNRVITFRLCREWDGAVPLTDEELDNTALHEVCHLFFEPFSYFATERFVDANQMQSEREALVCRLSALVMKVDWGSDSES